MGTDGRRGGVLETIQQGLALVRVKWLAATDGGAAGERDAEIVQPVVAVYGGIYSEGAGEGGGGCCGQWPCILTLCGSRDDGHGADEEDAAAERLAV